MAFLTEPAHTPMQVRENAYSRPCVQCGSIVQPGSGVAFMLWDARLEKNTWRSAHDCADDGYCFQAFKLNEPKPALAVAGPIAARQLAERPASLEEVAEAIQQPFMVPTAEALAALMGAALDEAVRSIGRETAEQFTALVPGMVAEGLLHARPIAISVNKAPAVTIKRAHKALPTILTAVVAGTSPFLVGPAGSGKTTLAEQIATALGLKFYMASRVTSEYKLVGFVDANGKTVRTQFREAYEHGGIFLFDEVDASDPDALTAFNAALAGQLADFPDGMVRRHADFAALAAGNTFGRGADRQYVGRNQLDAATLDRFQTFEIDYDEELERQLAGDAVWCTYVQKVRAAIEHEKVRHVVSPRASISGAKLLAAGIDRAVVEQACVWKGMDAAQMTRVINRMGAL